MEEGFKKIKQTICMRLSLHVLAGAAYVSINELRAQFFCLYDVFMKCDDKK